MNIDAAAYIHQKFEEVHEKNTKQKRKMSFWPKWKKRVKKLPWYKISLVIAIFLFAVPQVGEAIWDATVLKKVDPMDLYRLSNGLYFLMVMFLCWQLRDSTGMITKLIEILTAQGEQVTLLKKMLESKAIGSVPDLDAIFGPSRKKSDDDDGDLTN